MRRDSRFIRRSWFYVFVVLLISVVVFIWIRSRHGIKFRRTQFTPVSNLLIYEQVQHVGSNQSFTCERWAVVAPADSKWVSEAVRRQARLQDWCLVIVFDKEPNVTYDPEWYQGRGNKAVVFLTRDDVQILAELALLKILPWKEFGRKLIGYIYAIAHGATVIWDFDDSNMLKFWIPGAAPPGAPSLEAIIPNTESIKVREPQGHSWTTYNPHPALQPPSLPSWPRGLPLDDAMNQECSKGELKESQMKSNSLAVLHSLSDRQPDADIILQGTMPFPFFFKRTTETVPLLVPPNTFTPYNAKATLHLQSGFWAMYLPLTVDHGLGDVWRSYISQRLFWEAGLRIGITARPLVVQDHDIHFTSELAKEELKSSHRTKELLSFLCAWRGTTNTFVNRVGELWLELSKHKFVHLADVGMLQLWLQSLEAIGYDFPKLADNSIHCPGYPTDIALKMPLFPKNDTIRYTAQRNKLEYNDEECDTYATNLTFWNSDTHYGTRIDMSSYLGSLGQNAYEAVGVRQNFHPSVWTMPGVHLYNQISNVIKNSYPDWHGMNSRLTESMIQENFEFYKNDPTCASVDAFHCLFPASMCEMWMPFNKTIIINPAHRYSMGRCTREEFDRLNEHLRMLAAMEHPKHIMAASSKYDMEYLRHYSGIRDVLPLYSRTETYLGHISYKPTRPEIILFLCKWNPNFFWDNRFVTEIKKFKIVNVRTLYHNFLFSNFAQHRAAVFLPYAVMSYKITELYRVGIPLFFPSMKYLQNIRPIGDDRTILAQYYCARTGLNLKDSDMVAHPNSIHPYSPNLQENVDKESEYYWLQFSDFFQWPYITYFDDFKDLERQLENAEFGMIHDKMMEENMKRRQESFNNWCKVFNKIEKGRKMPQNYESAIKQLYGVPRLQVF